MANSRTGNIGENNFIFKYNGDQIEFDKEYITIGDVLVRDEDDEEDEDDVENGSFVIECFEITASNFLPWIKKIVLKNATSKKFKVEVTYPGVDFDEEKRRYVIKCVVFSIWQDFVSILTIVNYLDRALMRLD